MKIIAFAFIVVIISGSAVAETVAEVKKTTQGIELPKDFRQWRWVASSYRTDKNSLRVIIANDIAWKAMQAGNKHFPDGAMLGKIAWKEKHHEKFAAAIVPAQLQQIDFMQKDKQFSATGGWGFSRWLGTDLKRETKDIEGKECLACHSAAQENDYVFTQPAMMPK